MNLSDLLTECGGLDIVLVGRTSLAGRQAFERLVRQAGERAVYIRLVAGLESLTLDDGTRITLIRTHADALRGMSPDLVCIDTETYDQVGVAIHQQALIALAPAGGNVVAVDFSG